MLQPDLAQQLLDSSRNWDAEKLAALERFMTRPRAVVQPPASQQPSTFVRHIQQLQHEPPEAPGTGPLSSFYRILKDAPAASLLLPGGDNALSGSQQQLDLQYGAAGAARRTPSRAGALGAAARYDPYARPTPLGSSRPPSRSGLLPPVPPSPLAR
jgi:hypothetical protein